MANCHISLSSTPAYAGPHVNKSALINMTVTSPEVASDKRFHEAIEGIQRTKEIYDRIAKSGKNPEEDPFVEIHTLAMSTLNKMTEARMKAESLPEEEAARLKEYANGVRDIIDGLTSVLANLKVWGKEYAETAEQSGPESSDERASFIEAKAKEKAGVADLSFQITAGRDKYLAGGISDGQYFTECIKEIDKIKHFFTTSTNRQDED